jgi:hypothetical protein
MVVEGRRVSVRGNAEVGGMLEQRWRLRRAGPGGTAVGPDGGAGLFSMCFGLLVFLIFLFFTVHFMFYLRTRSLAADAALIGAHRLADQGDRSGHPDVVENTRKQADSMLGGIYRDSWRGRADRSQEPDARYVSFSVKVQMPEFPASAWVGSWASSPLVRSARVRVEARR